MDFYDHGLHIKTTTTNCLWLHNFLLLWLSFTQLKIATIATTLTTTVVIAKQCSRNNNSFINVAL